MLIRIAGHFPNNPNHIDKLICIKGLPEEWIVRESRFGGKELLYPWEPDVEVNIHKSIRHLCDPMEITKVFPPIEKGREYVVDKKTILGLKFDYMTEPGHELWDKIERYLDRMTPRDQKVPEPVIVAPNHKSDFNPHRARRTVRGSLEFEACEVPVVDLRPVSVPTAILTPPTTTSTHVVASVEPVKSGEPSNSVEPVKVEPIPEKKEDLTRYPCQECPKIFTKERALRMHTTVIHKKKKSLVGV